MSASNPQNPLPRNRRPVFRPLAILTLLYFAGFFFFFSLLLILPELLDVLADLPPGPGQQEAAERIAREAARPKLPIALLLATVTTALGGYLRILPGIQPR